MKITIEPDMDHEDKGEALVFNKVYCHVIVGERVMGNAAVPFHLAAAAPDKAIQLIGMLYAMIERLRLVARLPQQPNAPKIVPATLVPDLNQIRGNGRRR